MTQKDTLADVLSEFARTMVTDFPIQRILDRLVERMVDILPVDAAGVTLIEPGVEPRYVAASDPDALRYEQLQTLLAEGPCVLAYESGVAISVPDLSLEHRFPTYIAKALEAGLAAVFTFPLNHGERPLGALDLYRKTAGPLSEESLAVAQTLADVASAYILNAQAREDLVDSSALSREAALHDALTGLPNRVLMLDRIEHAFLRSRRSGKLSAVFFLDLDRFKSVNDMYGHQVGDGLLIAVAQRLTSMLRPGDTLARLAGDEFVILCEGLDTPEQAAALAARLDVGLERPLQVDGLELKISTSVGVAVADDKHHDPEQVLHYADTAMYQAKRRGGARLKIFEPSDHAELELERDLHNALERGELRADYQPIVTTDTGQIIGFEALLRWDHPTRGAVSPSIAIPIAERSALIDDIGRFVLEQAWGARNRWHQMLGGADLTMAVNVSARQLMSAAFAETLSTVVGSSGDDICSLTLEVTESIFVRDTPRALKVDRGFVSGLGNDRTSAMIIQSVVQLAHALSMSVIAEGVETTGQRSQVSELGCESSQGYYFARPMSAEAVDSLIENRLGSESPRLPIPQQRQAGDILAPL